jgi:hypothetical protein
VGVDMVFGHFNIKTAIYHKYEVKHYFRNSNIEEASKKMIDYFKKIGFYNYSSNSSNSNIKNSKRLLLLKNIK